jgi:cbb3-type cytochrome oxidase subunit 3
MSRIAVTNRSKLEWKIGSTIILIVFGLMIYLVVWFLYTGSPREIVAIADQFKPGQDWTLKQEHIEPPRSFCVDVDCPSVSRRWSLPQELDKQKFEEIALIGKNHLVPTDSCFEKNKSGETIKLCDAVGTIDGYHITLTYSGNHYSDGKPGVSLYIE